MRLDVEPRRTLADALREDLGLTGTHLGCEHGVCGACTVLVDGAPARACLMFAVQCDGSSVDTVEGLAGAGRRAAPPAGGVRLPSRAAVRLLHPRDADDAAHLLETHPDPDRATIRAEMSGNICRCTGYQGIVDAVEAAARTGSSARPEAEPL